MSFEAAWNEDGAVCVAHPRIRENITLAEIATRFDHLASRHTKYGNVKGTICKGFTKVSPANDSQRLMHRAATADSQW